MNSFTQLFLQLDQTNKTNDKIIALENFFKEASPQDRLWMIALFTGRSPKRVVNSRHLKEWVMDLTGLPEWIYEETYHVIGDLAETLALLLPPPKSHYQGSLSDWMTFIQQLDGWSLKDKKRLLTDMWQQLEPKERLVFNKVLIGGFRLGVSQNLIIRALSHVTQLEIGIIAHRLMGDWDPLLINPEDILSHSEEENIKARPYPFCLAYPLDVELEALGSPTEWLVEWKWDGIRGQIVHRQDFFTVWSRGEETITERFPEFLQLAQLLPQGTVIDGEILAYVDEKILPFQALQQRIGRKKVTQHILKEIPVVFYAYDLIEYAGQDLRQQPLSYRRKQLQKLIKELPYSHLLYLSPQLEITTWDQLNLLRLKSRDHAAEGVMIKKFDSPYHVGRKRGDWWKWKIDAYTVDGVLIYAQKGHGWRANVFSDYTFAVWDSKGQLIPFAKAYSGLNKQELKEVDHFIKTHTVEKFGPVRSVTPTLVFEIAFEGIQASKRHKSGVAVRFPRIQRWRRDKKPEDADTIETLQALLKASL